MAVCETCFRRCELKEGQTGFCGGRVCENGVVTAKNYGRVTALALDPIEKKPLYRFHPGGLILSVGSYGCNLRCPFCQNSGISWSREALSLGSSADYISPEQLAEIYCMGEGLENKIAKESRTHLTLQSLVDSLTSKRYTSSAMRRLLLYMLMNIKGKELPEAMYARVLAADRLGRDFIRESKERGGIDIITNVNKEMPEDDQIRRCLEIDMRAADIYNYLTGSDEYANSDRVVKPFII